ncbi:MAG: hypothetical protein AAGC68_05205 [Verrucomicrobiota bacterium]
MNTDDNLAQLFERARSQLPFGPPEDYGFETRLRASLGESDPAFAEVLARFSCRLSLFALPLAIGLVTILAFQASSQLPEGFGGFVAHWSSYLPLEL